MRRTRKRDIFNFFSLFISFLDLRKSDCRFLSQQKVKLDSRRELRVGTNILAFRQSSRDRKFPYLYYFEPKGYIMAWNILRSRDMP